MGIAPIVGQNLAGTRLRSSECLMSATGAVGAPAAGGDIVDFVRRENRCPFHQGRCR